MARSVLRVADQVAGVFPDRCVLSGVETSNAVRTTATQFGGPRWLLGVPVVAMVIGRLPGHQRLAVALPVSLRVWRMWRARNVSALSMLTVGATLFSIGGATGTVPLAVFGIIVGIGAMGFRARATHNFWFICRLHPVEATIVVEPTHPRFDEAARALFIRTLT